MNKLSGTIPPCLINITAMVQEGFSLEHTLHYYLLTYTSIGGGGRQVDDNVDYALIRWQRDEREFRSTNLGLLKSIDLSSNSLIGEIPYEITGLYKLLALNLSRNSLHGEVPRKIGQMKSLLALDLSKNNLSGGIPSSMSGMTLLGYLDLSDNNLLGRIPSSTQIQSFDPSKYTGNAKLCGPPITKSCPGDEAQEVPIVIVEDAGVGEGWDDLWRWFNIGGGTGFVTGFWIARGALFLNRRERHAFSCFLDSLNDWIYVRVRVFSAKFQRVAHT